MHVEDEFGTVYSDGRVRRGYGAASEGWFITNTEVRIARQFNGYIQGIKYFKRIFDDLRP